MSRSTIEWTDEVWNPVRGCRKITAGCRSCYAEAFAKRFEGTPGHVYELGFAPRTAPDQLAAPLRWKKPRRVFVKSMSDLFLEDFSNEYIAAVFGVMAATPQHTYQVLTKRHERLREWFEWIERQGAQIANVNGVADSGRGWATAMACVMYASRVGVEMSGFEHAWNTWPLPNAWIGVSAEDQDNLRKRAAELVQVPAAVRFLSLEPLLGPVDFDLDLDGTANRFGVLTCPVCRGWGGMLTSLYPDVNGHEQIKGCRNCQESGCAIDWVIVGGESGHRARPFEFDWARSVVSQCREASVACFLKQMGANPHGEWTGDNAPTVHVTDLTGAGERERVELHRHKNGRWKLRDRKGGTPSEWPAGDWPRQFPGDDLSAGTPTTTGVVYEP